MKKTKGKTKERKGEAKTARMDNEKARESHGLWSRRAKPWLEAAAWRADAALVSRFAGLPAPAPRPRRLEPRARPNRRKTARDHPPIRLKQRQAAANLQQQARAGANPKARKSAGKEWARRLRESQEGNQMEQKKKKGENRCGRSAGERRREKKSRRPAMRAGDGDLVPKSRLELPTY